MITLKSPREIEKMAESGKVLAGVHLGLRNMIKPGLDTWDIEIFARKYIKEHGGYPSEMGFEGYKFATCVSVNDEVAHGIPRKGLILKDGDVAKDMHVHFLIRNSKGFHQFTGSVGQVNPILGPVCQHNILANCRLNRADQHSLGNVLFLGGNIK